MWRLRDAVSGSCRSVGRANTRTPIREHERRNEMADQQVTQAQSSGNRSVARQSDALFPFAPFRRELERMFDDFFSVFGVPARGDGEAGQLPAGIIAPRIDVTETDDQVRITAELPGVDEEDIDVRLVDEVLTIRAEAQT